MISRKLNKSLCEELYKDLFQQRKLVKIRHMFDCVSNAQMFLQLWRLLYGSKQDEWKGCCQ